MFGPLFGFDPDDFVARQRRKTFETLAPNAVAWSPDMKFETPLVIRGETYNQPRLFETTQSYGNWTYLNKTLRRGEWLQTLQGAKGGIVAFTTDVNIPVLQTSREIWMSLTPMEVFTCRSGIRAATGNVVIGGLGMGYMLREICAKKSVKKVIVVEKSKELLDWFGYRICGEQPKVVDVINDSIYTVADQVVQSGAHVTKDSPVFILDIWKNYGGNGDEREIIRLRRQYKVWCWGESGRNKSDDYRVR